MTGNGLPQGWRVAELGGICRQERIAIAKTDATYATMPYLGLEHIEPNTGRILVNERDARDSGSKSNNFRFTPEHVLYGKLRPYLNKVALPEFSGRCTTEMIPLKPLAVDRRWLAWLLRRREVVDYAMRGKTGSQMPRASMRDLMALSVAVPPSDRQRRVVVQLERQMAMAARVRRATNAQLAGLGEMLLALLRRTFPELSSKRLPQGWRWGKLGDLCEIVNGSTPRSVKQYWDGSICWITPTDLGQLRGPRIEGSARTITKQGYESCSTKLVRPGAVVMSSRAPIGHLGIATIPLCTNQGCKAFVPTAAVETRFLYYMLRYAMDNIRALGSGATFLEVGKKKLGSFAIPLPPTQQQRQIADALETHFATLERARAAAQSQLGAVDRFSGAVLRHAFEP